MTTPTLRPELQITRDEIVEGEREIEGPVPGHPALRFVAYAWLTPGHKTDFVSRLPESCIREIEVFRGDRRIHSEVPHAKDFRAVSEHLLQLGLGRRFDDGELVGKAHMKTGSLDHVTSIAGYLQSRSGRRFIVVVLQNAEDPRKFWIKVYRFARGHGSFCDGELNAIQ